jgi:glycerate kinase
MSKKKKTMDEMLKELNLFIFLKDKEIAFFENVQESGMHFIPQKKRKHTIKELGKIIEAKKKELETYKLPPY